MGFRIKLKHYWNKLRLYLSFLLLAFYLTMGYLFLFTNTWIDFLRNGRVIVGIVLLLFGALRFYVAYFRYKKKHTRITSILETETNAEKE